MKKSTEMVWIVNLISESSLKNFLFLKKGASISSMEKFAKAPTNNKYFREWFKNMISIRIFEPYNDVYLINKSKMYKYLKEFEYFQKIRKIIDDNPLG